ncbi:MAG: glycerophosphodiester phosphodiesterase [Candidatus Tectimicrobiota bacterium]
MGGNPRPPQVLRGGLYVRLKASRPGRRLRLRHTLRALHKREQAVARSRPGQVVTAPRLWQRCLFVPLASMAHRFRHALVWLRSFLLPVPSAILEVDPAQFLVVGHRGACASAVENTIESCERAVQIEGADAVEIDLCVTRDEQVVLWHDWDPDTLVAWARQAEAEMEVLCRPVVPPTGHPMRRPVCDLTLAEFRQHYGYAIIGEEHTVPVHLPVLAEVVRWARTKPQLKAVFLDCKVPPSHKALIMVVVAALRREIEQEPIQTRFVFLTPYTEVLDLLRTVLPAAERSFDVEIPAGVFPHSAQLSAVAWARASGNEWASIGRPLFTLGGWWLFRQTIRADLALMREARAATPPVPPTAYVCWTINRRREMRYLMRLGVSGLLTDYPTRLRRLRNRQLRQHANRMARRARQQARRGRHGIPE